MKVPFDTPNAEARARQFVQDYCRSRRSATKASMSKYLVSLFGICDEESATQFWRDYRHLIPKQTPSQTRQMLGLRKALKLSQAEFAEALGIKRDTVADVETYRYGWAPEIVRGAPLLLKAWLKNRINQHMDALAAFQQKREIPDHKESKPAAASSRPPRPARVTRPSFFVDPITLD